MKMSGEYRIAAPRDAVWSALNDPEILRQCIPGCEALDQVSATEMTGAVTAKIGPVKATFKGDVDTIGNLTTFHNPQTGAADRGGNPNPHLRMCRGGKSGLRLRPRRAGPQDPVHVHSQGFRP